MTDEAFITGDVRQGAQFQFTNPPRRLASSTFSALVDGKLIVTRRATEIFHLPDNTPVLAHWHGEWRTDGFATTIAELKAKAQIVDEDEAQEKARAKQFADAKLRKKAEVAEKELAKLKAKIARTAR
jgi:hypothetical protein